MINNNIKKIVSIISFILILSISNYSFAAYTSIRPGTTGNDVLALQQKLNALGYSTNGVDGKYGRGTQSAVEKFQKDRGLYRDGIAGNQTLTLLYGSASPVQNNTATNNNPVTTVTPNNKLPQSVTLPSESLIYGVSNNYVKDMQLALNSLGFSTNGSDGKFGKGTERAVKKFQQKYKLGADGKAGIQTLTKLYNLCNIKIVSANTQPAPKPPTNQNNQNTQNPQNNKPTTNFNSNKRPSNLPAKIQLPEITLEYGAVSDDVKYMQIALTHLGFNTNGADGKFGEATVKALKSFQTKYRLSVDGKAGNQTLKLLYDNCNVVATGRTTTAQNQAAGGARTYSPVGTLKNGSKGEEVKKLQNALATLNFYDSYITGNYDEPTLKSVKAFQKKYNIDADGVAGAATQRAIQQLLAGQTPSIPQQAPVSSQISFNAPNVGNVKLLHWFNDIRTTLKTGNTVKVYEPKTGAGWQLKVLAGGRHLDAEPITANDTAQLFKAFGGKETWTPKVVYVQLPNGAWTLATTHDVAHDGQTIRDNNFNGHLCVHFLRDMDETVKNDPNYGVTNQNIIRNAWRALTGNTIK